MTLLRSLCLAFLVSGGVGCQGTQMTSLGSARFTETPITEKKVVGASQNLGGETETVSRPDKAGVDIIKVTAQNPDGNDIDLVIVRHIDRDGKVVDRQVFTASSTGVLKSIAPAALNAAGYSIGQAVRRPDNVDVNGGGNSSATQTQDQDQETGINF